MAATSRGVGLHVSYVTRSICSVTGWPQSITVRCQKEVSVALVTAEVGCYGMRARLHDASAAQVTARSATAVIELGYTTPALGW